MNITDFSVFKGICEGSISMLEDAGGLVSSVREGAFAACGQLSSVALPECVYIGAEAFYFATQDALQTGPLVDVSFPKCESIGNQAFFGQGLREIRLPACTSLGANAFGMCGSLQLASLPSCSIIPSNCFNMCVGLSSVYAPSCVTLGSGAFSNCTSLSLLSLPAITSIGSYAFSGCSNFSALYIGTSACVLANSNAFAETGITSNSGTIYVPMAYVESYKASTNWAYFSTQIVGY